MLLPVGWGEGGHGTSCKGLALPSQIIVTQCGALEGILLGGGL